MCESVCVCECVCVSVCELSEDSKGHSEFQVDISNR